MLPNRSVPDVKEKREQWGDFAAKRYSSDPCNVHHKQTGTQCGIASDVSKEFLIRQ